MISTFALRTMLEMAKRATLQTEPAASNPSTMLVDTTWIPIPDGQEKAARLARDPSQVDTIVAHVTGVRGGFGVVSRRVTHWQAEAALRGLDPRDLARFERIRGTPYHGLGLRTLHALRNRDLAQRSYHGGPAGNHGVGFALDMHPDEEMSEEFAQTGRFALIDLAWRLQDAGAKPPFRIIAHRQVEPPNRRGNDPGARPWRHVFLPAATEHPDLLWLDLDHAANGGLPIPRSWDPASSYDDRGRRLER